MGQGMQAQAVAHGNHCVGKWLFPINRSTVLCCSVWDAKPCCDNRSAMSQAYVLTLSCPDRLGLVHAVSGFLLEHGGNIEEAAQYNDTATGLFFMRVQFACSGHDHAALSSTLRTFAEPYQMRWSLHATAQPMPTVILVSRDGHCLNDLLFRWKSGLLPVDIRAIISNHRSFLPSFKGAKPYYQAHDRGVKLIGATAHYVTADLDEGPIIEQDVARADHTDTVEALTARGRDTESQVLARAVQWHSQHRVLQNGHKTVVFR